MKTNLSLLALCLLLPISSFVAHGQDPLLNSWFTAHSGEYARVYRTSADLQARTAVTTWSRGSTSQLLPAYSGVQEVSYSADWLYLRTSGLGSQIMGPWYLDAAQANLFPNLPANTKSLYRLPRSPTVLSTRTLTSLGVIGYFVDGVAMFDGRDGFYWNGTAETGGAGSGYWNRDAYVNESVTFDPALAHQQQTGTYHYHANPIALRYLLGDHVQFNSATQTYSESSEATTRHSPILGWVADGFPVYGPYGYSNATNPASGVRRMVSGFVLRNGQNGADNLSTTGRTSIPAWAVRLYSVAAAQSGPAVSTTYPLGRYMEDNSYLGDLGKTQGIDFDLDEYNGRWCITPEFPGGTYAYFVSISANGVPQFPYNIGRAYYGSPRGGTVSSISEPVTISFLGGTNTPTKLNPPAVDASAGTVTLTWNGVEGGSYVLEKSLNDSSWSVVLSNIAPAGAQGQAIETNVISPSSFYRVGRTSVANFDPAYGSSSGSTGGISSVSPASAVRGTTVIALITFSSAANPAVPPQNAPVLSVTIGSISGTSVTRPTQYTLEASFTIPANANVGPCDITVVFPGPPDNPTQTVTYTLTGGFNIN